MNSNDMRKKVNGSPYHQFSILEDNRDMYMHVYSMAINKLLIIEQIQFYEHKNLTGLVIKLNP